MIIIHFILAPGPVFPDYFLKATTNNRSHILHSFKCFLKTMEIYYGVILLSFQLLLNDKLLMLSLRNYVNMNLLYPSIYLGCKVNKNRDSFHLFSYLVQLIQIWTLTIIFHQIIRLTNGMSSPQICKVILMAYPLLRHAPPY